MHIAFGWGPFIDYLFLEEKISNIPEIKKGAKSIISTISIVCKLKCTFCAYLMPKTILNNKNINPAGKGFLTAK